jgi:thiol-disulfide isomerase/thioredoxin
MKTVNFNIESNEAISQQFLQRNIFNFEQAIYFMKQMPYGRNSNKNDLTILFAENCGTCSSKHALLKQLAIENNFAEIKLMVGLFKMNETNASEVAATLLQNHLEFIPEAHCYLRFDDEIIDATKANSQASDFVADLIEEIEIQPNQITNFKVEFHKNYLQKWLNENKEIKFSLDEIWNVREQCIKDLTTI